MVKLSVITTTFNRADLLERCYRSLLRQTCKDFEWILIDDGSTDDTPNVIDTFDVGEFPIIKIQKRNGGKHRALNAAHSFLHGEYVLILDSDDYLTDTAVEEVLSAWERYKGQHTIGILTFLKGTADHEPVCTVEDYEKPVEILRYRRRIRTGSDCCEVVRAELFKEFPFPEYAEETFIAECALWNRIGRDHYCVYIDSVIYVCDYLEDGLTKSGRALRIRNPKGGMFTSNLRMDNRNYICQRFKYGVLFTCYGCFAKEGLWKQLKDTDYPILAAVCFPVGFTVYLAWRYKYL